MGLGSRAFTATSWLYGLRIFSRLIGLGRTIILARLLAPGDFGLVAIALLTISALEVLTRSGLGHSVVHKTEVSRYELHVIWSFELLRGIFLGILMFLTAPLIGTFMNNPGSVPVIRALSVVPVLQVLRNVDMLLIWKELHTKKMGAVDLSSQVVSAATGISLAILFPSVWVLVVATLVDYLTRVIMSYVVSPGSPKLVWNWSIIKYHFKYGRQVMGAGISWYLYNNLDDWFVGKFLGAPALGLYSKAYQLGNLPTTELTMVLGQVLFPIFSKLQNNTARLAAAFINIQKMLSLLIAPIVVFMFLYAESLVGIILGDQWLPMVPAFQILTLWGGMRAIREVSTNLFFSVGRPSLVSYTIIAKLILMAVLLWPASDYGITGIAFVVLLTSVWEFPVVMWLVANQLKLPYLAVYKPLLVPSLVALFAAIIIFLLNPGQSIIQLLWGFVGTFGLYLLLMFGFDHILKLNQFAEISRLWYRVRNKPA